MRIIFYENGIFNGLLMFSVNEKKSLFQKYRPLIAARVYDTAQKYGLDTGDLLSVAWEGFNKGCNTFDAAKGALPAWLDTCVTGALSAYARRESRHGAKRADVECEKLAAPESVSDREAGEVLVERFPDCNLLGLRQICAALPWRDKQHAARLIKTNTASTWHLHTLETATGKTEYFTHINSAAAGASTYRARAVENQTKGLIVWIKKS